MCEDFVDVGRERRAVADKGFLFEDFAVEMTLESWNGYLHEMT